MSELITLRPLEAVLFRDARPFDANGQQSARGLDPQPATVFGAVRTAALSRVCSDVDAYARGGRCRSCNGSNTCPAVDTAGPPGTPGHADHTGTVTLRGCCLHDAAAPSGEQLLFPAPASLTAIRAPGEPGVELRGPRTFAGSWDVLPSTGGLALAEAPLPVAVDPDAHLPAWVTVTQLEALLEGRLPGGLGHPRWRRVAPGGSADDQLSVSETRVGLARRDGEALPGFLYRAEFRRYRPDVAIAAIADLPAAEDGVPRFAPFVPFGGKGRHARVEAHPLAEWPAPPDPRPGRFAVCIMTPAYFGEKWHPDVPEGARFVSAAVGPAIASKGWDVARRRSRPVRWLCPAGSVWWYDADTEAAAAALAAWHGRTICTDRPRAGYGLAFVSNWEVSDGPT